MTGDRQKHLVAITAAAAILAGGTAATAGDERGPEAGSTDRAAVAAVAPEATELIAAFRRDQTADDRLPGDPHAALTRLGEAQPGEQPGMARRLAFADGQRLHIWPMSHGVCYADRGDGGCAPTALLRQRGILIGASYSGNTSVVRVYAIARDGIDSAVFTLEDGREVPVPIRDNGFIADVPSPRSLEWVNGDGSTGRDKTFAAMAAE